jgi:hypothetical protein
VRTFVVALVATFGVLIPALPAAAGAFDDMAANPFVTQTGPNTVNVGIERAGAAAHVTRAGTAGVAVCTYDIYSGDSARQLLLIHYGVDVVDVDPDVRYVFRVCRDGSRPVDLVATYRLGTPITQVVIDAMVVSAYDHLEIPVLVQSSSPNGDATAPLITQLPTWLWIDAASWVPVSRDAAVPGARVVATATPISTRWTPRTGAQRVACLGPGVAYDPSQNDSAQSTGCSVTYTESSAGQPDAAFAMELTVVWSVSWVCAPACGSGALPGFEITSSRPVRVAQIQALNTRSR